MNVAARLEQAAAPERDPASASQTYRLVRDAVDVEPVEPLALKGKSEPVAAFRLLAVARRRRGHRPTARRADGRAGARARACSRDAFERAVATERCALVHRARPGRRREVAGSSQEFLAGSAADARSSAGRCLPYGEGITYWPLVEICAHAAGIGDRDGPDEARAKLTALVGDEPDATSSPSGSAAAWDSPAPRRRTEETFWAVREAARGAGAPSGRWWSSFDDLHWAEPTLLDLVEHVADWSRDAPILLVCTARPELLDARPGWGGGEDRTRPRSCSSRSSEDESDALIANLLGRTTLAAGRSARIAEAAEGNPLFVEQMVAMLVDDGAARGERRRLGAWSATSRACASPRRSSALLAAGSTACRPTSAP